MTALRRKPVIAPFRRSSRSHLLLAPVASATLFASPLALHAQSVVFAGTESDSSATAVDFGKANLCAAGKTTPAPCSKTLTLKYKVTAGRVLGTPKALTLGSPNLDFTLASGSACAGSVSTGETCTVNTVNVKFAPLYAGPASGAVQVVSESGAALAATPVLGTGAGPQVGTLANGVTAFSTPSLPAQIQGQIVIDGAGDTFGIANSGDALLEQPANGGAEITILVTGLSGPIASPLAIDGAGKIFAAGPDANGDTLESGPCHRAITIG